MRCGLGLKRELDEIDDPDGREERVHEMVAHAHEHAKGLNAASIFEFDDVIDPIDSRRVIATTLAAARSGQVDRAEDHPRPVDTW